MNALLSRTRLKHAGLLLGALVVVAVFVWQAMTAGMARGVGLLPVAFLLAPIEDGCKYDRAAANGAHKTLVHSAQLAAPLPKGIR